MGVYHLPPNTPRGRYTHLGSRLLKSNWEAAGVVLSGLHDIQARCKKFDEGSLESVVQLVSEDFDRTLMYYPKNMSRVEANNKHACSSAFRLESSAYARVNCQHGHDVSQRGEGRFFKV